MMIFRRLFVTVFFCGCFSPQIFLIGNPVKMNPDNPLRGVLALPSKPLFIIRNAGNDPFFNIGQIAVAPDGEILIADRKISVIRRFNRDGNYLSSLGRQGEGPGEFKILMTVFPLKDSIIVNDLTNRLHFFSRNGEYRETIPYSPGLFPRVMKDSDTAVSAPYVINHSDPPGAGLTVSLLDVRGGKNRTLFTYRGFSGGAVREQSGERRFSFLFADEMLTPVAHVALDGDLLYFGNSDRFEIRVYNLKTAGEFSFGVNRAARKASEEFIAERLKPLQFPDDVKKKLRENLTGEIMLFQDIFTDAGKRVWIYVQEADGSGEREFFDVFSPEGQYWCRAPIVRPPGTRVVARFLGEQRLYLGFEDAEGELAVYVFDLAPLFSPTARQGG